MIDDPVNEKTPPTVPAPVGEAAGPRVGAHPDLPLLELLREDWVTHDRSLMHPGLHALALHRVGVWRYSRPPAVRKVLSLAYKVLNTLVRNVYGIEIYETTRIGRRVWLPHHMGVLLGRASVIGDDCLVRQHVTLGQTGAPESGEPVLGRGVEVGAGAVIMGGITVGDGARIGPNAVVLTNVPPGATVIAPPAKTMRPAAPVAPAGEPTSRPGAASA